MDVPFLHLKKHNLLYKKQLHESLDKCLENGDFILGKELVEFEKEFSDYINSDFAIGVGNCHDGLYLILKSLGIGEGDEVIVPSNTFIATWFAVINTGAKPVPVEPNLESYNLDPYLIQKSITDATKAIIVVHLYGLCCEMDKIREISKKNNLFLIEDCAQSLGSKYKNQKAGILSDAASFSFYPSKNLGALGDGGMITTSNKGIAKDLKKMRAYGSIEKYKNDLIGSNSRLDELQASFLRIKLKNIDIENKIRNELANIYFNELKEISNFIKLPFYDETISFHSWHLFVILSKERDALVDHLRRHNIDTILHYPIPPHKQKCFENSHISKYNLPISEKIHKECISLPISSLHTKKEIYYVCKNILEFYKNS